METKEIMFFSSLIKRSWLKKTKQANKTRENSHSRLIIEELAVTLPKDTEPDRERTRRPLRKEADS